MAKTRATEIMEIEKEFGVDKTRATEIMEIKKKLVETFVQLKEGGLSITEIKELCERAKSRADQIQLCNLNDGFGSGN